MLRPKPSRQQIIQTTSVPAPVGGINARDAIANMPATDALAMSNWFPTPGTLDVRNGSIDWSTGITGWVETLMAYNGLGVYKIFAATATAIYDVTAQGAAVLTPVTPLTSGRWNTVMFSTPAAHFLVAVNGQDLMQIYDGTNWRLVYNGGPATISSITAVGTTATLTTATAHGLYTGNTVTISGATPAAYNGTFVITVVNPTRWTYTTLTAPGGNATVVGTYTTPISITGVATSVLQYPAVFKGRMYFIEKNTLHVWYLPVGQLGGAASLFDMSTLFQMGGFLVAMSSWSVDTASGPQDYMVFLSSEGEVVVYQGYDPTQSGSWGLQATFKIGRPIGVRPILKVGPDILIVTADGIVPLSSVQLTDRTSPQTAISSKIQNLINNDIATYAANFGWQICIHPIGTKLIINVPQVEDTLQYQYIMNTQTQSWTRFDGWLAACWVNQQDQLFYGTNGKVVKADIGVSDNGIAIQTSLDPAFSYFGAPGQQKQYTLVRPIFARQGPFGVAGVLNTDFRTNSANANLQLPPQNASALWNVALWNVSFWSVEGVISVNWQTVFGVGYSASFHMETISAQNISLLSLDYGYQVGGVF